MCSGIPAFVFGIMLISFHKGYHTNGRYTTPSQPLAPPFLLGYRLAAGYGRKSSAVEYGTDDEMKILLTTTDPSIKKPAFRCMTEQRAMP